VLCAVPRPGDKPPAPRGSFAIHWTQRCEQSWRRAFLSFGLGIPALFVNLSVAAWIKFDQSVVAAVSTTVVLGLSLVAMLFFHRKWTSHILDEEKVDLVSADSRVLSLNIVVK
jgi:calcium release-activated calcium channel protein 1